MGPSIRPVTAPRLPVKVAALAFGASLLGACAGSPAGTATPTATPAPTFPIPIREGQAPAGVYTTTLFKPTVLFTIPSDGWRFFFTDDDDELAVGKGNAELTGGRVANVLEPTTHATIPAPDDLVAWLAAHPLLEAQPPKPVTVGGIAGTFIDVTNKGTIEVDIFAYPRGNLHVATGSTARVIVLPYDGPDIAFTVFGLTSEFQQSLAIVQPVVDSIVIKAG